MNLYVDRHADAKGFYIRVRSFNPMSVDTEILYIGASRRVPRVNDTPGAIISIGMNWEWRLSVKGFSFVSRPLGLTVKVGTRQR